MNAPTLNQTYHHVRRIFFPRWDENGDWKIKAVTNAPFDGCAIPMTRTISINSDLLGGKELQGVIIHEICHALSSHKHDGQWQQHMLRAARKARELGEISLAEFLEKDTRQFKPSEKRLLTRSSTLTNRSYGAMIPGKRLNILMRLLRNLKLLGPLIKDYWRGSYRKVSGFSLLVFFLSLAYILIPLDLIPDYLPGLGQMDDLAVLGAGLYLLERDLLKYHRWRLQKKG